MKLTAVIALGSVLVLLASVYVLNRPQLTTIDAAIPENFPGDGFSHEVLEQLLQTYLDGAGHVDYESWHNSTDSVRELNSTWRDWQMRYPNSQVLSMDTGFRRNYEVNPYPNYGQNGRLYFPVAEENHRYRRKSFVLGLEVDGRFKAYPFDELKKGPPQFTDQFQGRSFEVSYDNRNQTARIVEVDGDELPTLLAYWFAWYAFHPDTEIFTAN